MSNQQRIEIITSFQNNPMIHPLTCGNKSSHKNLLPIEKDNQVVLQCIDCSYIQLLNDQFIEMLYKLDKNSKEIYDKYKSRIGRK